MKKVLSLVMALAIMFSLAACGNRNKVIPSGFTAETYEQATSALELMDKYLSEKMSPAELAEKMEPIYQGINAESKRLQRILDDDPSDKDTLLLSMDTGNLALEINAFLLGANGEKSYNCQALRDALYEKLNPANP